MISLCCDRKTGGDRDIRSDQLPQAGILTSDQIESLFPAFSNHKV